MRQLLGECWSWRRSPILQRGKWSFCSLFRRAKEHMTQEAKSLNGQPEGAMSSALTAAPDNPPPELDIPQQCSLQWDALMEASDKLDAAALLLEQRAIAMANCIAGLNKPVQPWPAPAPGGEYVNVTNAPAARASAMSYKRQQIDETIGLIAGARRRLKDLLRTR